jgi:hypothetical protein
MRIDLGILPAIDEQRDDEGRIVVEGRGEILVPHLEGQWAVLRERISHGADKDIRRAIMRAREDPELRAEVDTITVRAFLVDWHVRAVGTEDEWLAIDDLERADKDVINRLVQECGPLYLGATELPKATGRSSSAR